MDPLTHAATGLIISQLLPLPSRFWGAMAGVVFAVLPDVDYFLAAWDRLAFIRHHRGFTHSLAAIPLLALLGAGINTAIGGRAWFKPFFLLGLAALASHLILDWATSYGTQIFSPFTREKFALDWLFIIDPYLTGLLLLGAIAAPASPDWGRKLGAGFLGAAMAYFCLCGLYHHQALKVARQIYQEAAPGGRVAALPQPFSCRRWQLLAVSPEGVRQTFVELPYTAFWGLRPPVNSGTVTLTTGSDCRVPPAAYLPPQDLRVQLWPGANPASQEYDSETRRILDIFLDFARFPLLYRHHPQGAGEVQEWLDLRFSVPGRAIPFVLQLRLDAKGRLEKWTLGRCG
jgi:inner membrane protein